MTTALASIVQEGNTVDYTPSVAVAAGDVVVQGTLVGIASVAIAANKKSALTVGVVGRFPHDGTSGSAISAGAKVYWDATNEVITETSGGNTYLGKVIAAVADSDTTGDVLMER